MARFVIQKHSARTLHYDFHLVRNEVFKSWAVSKGLPDRPGLRRLAIQVEDHSLSFGDFEGEIPEGKYEAGTVEILDKDSYTLHGWTDDRIVISLKGHRLAGRYCMIRFRPKGEQEWLIWRR